MTQRISIVFNLIEYMLKSPAIMKLLLRLFFYDDITSVIFLIKAFELSLYIPGGLYILTLLYLTRWPPSVSLPSSARSFRRSCYCNQPV